MKKMFSVCLMLILTSTAVMAEHVISSKKNPAFLYVLSARSGSLEGETLRLTDIPMVVYFSDRPARIAGHMGLKDFLFSYNKGADSFKVDPPNGVLSIYTPKGNDNIVVEIKNLEIKGNVLICSVRILEGNALSSFKNASLFIDSNCESVQSPACRHGTF